MSLVFVCDHFYVLFNRKKRKRLTEKVIHKQVRSLVPESQAYIELLRLEQKLDSVLVRKRLDLQETLKRPQKVFDFVFKSLFFVIVTFLLRSKRNYVYSLAINFRFVSMQIQLVSMMNKFNIGRCVSKVVFSKM